MLLTAMLAVDVGVNLRNPTAGETSATLNTMLGMGKPVIVSDIGTYREYPDLCCPKISTDDTESKCCTMHCYSLWFHLPHYARPARPPGPTVRRIVGIVQRSGTWRLPKLSCQIKRKGRCRKWIVLIIFSI